MKIAILANKSRSFVPILAEGLQRMLLSTDVEAEVFFDGLATIRFCEYKYSNWKRRLLGLYRKLEFYNLLDRLKKFDAIIIIGFLPDAFLKNFMMDKIIRDYLPDKPLILYSNYYLPTRQGWGEALKVGNQKLGILSGGNYGLERYDYYLCSSISSEMPLPYGEHPFCQIGLNLNDGSLYPQEKKEFIALIDFPRNSHMQEREVQIAALQETNIPFIELKGSYSREEIRAVYRQTSIYFLAHRESFGVPICEIQACGGLIFSAFPDWCPSHGIKDNQYQEGIGKLPSNFIVYNNSKDELIQKLQQVQQKYNANQVVQDFLLNHADFFYGNLDEVERFVSLLKNRKITSSSHNLYRKNLSSC